MDVEYTEKYPIGRNNILIGIVLWWLFCIQTKGKYIPGFTLPCNIPNST